MKMTKGERLVAEMLGDICLTPLSENSDINFTKKPKLYRIKALN